MCPLGLALLTNGALLYHSLVLLLNASPMESPTYHTVRLAFTQVATIVILSDNHFLQAFWDNYLGTSV